MTARLWMVVLEATAEEGASSFDVELHQRLLEIISGAEPDAPEPVALVTEGRHAVQIAVTAEDLTWAMSSAALRWRNALRAIGIGGWKLVRAEVATWEEFRRENEEVEA